MAGNLELARPYLVLLAIVTLGRWLQSVFGVPYEKGHHVFSIMILTYFSALYYGAFLRRWRRATLPRVVAFAVTIAVLSQLVVLVMTVASYALGMETYFNHPRALNRTEPVSLVAALPIRLGGLVGNPIITAIFGAIGWLLGGLLPEAPAERS